MRQVQKLIGLLDLWNGPETPDQGKRCGVPALSATPAPAIEVPVPKVFFDGSLLHSSILRGEEEVLVIGGAFEVRVRLY